MSSPELMRAQVDRWMNSRVNKAVSSVGDIKVLEKEILHLREQESRYNKAYGAGVFTIEQLQEYTTPVKEQIASLQVQISKAKQQETQAHVFAQPSEAEINTFADKATAALPGLSFETKREIVVNVVEKIVATQQKLEVNGYLPITSNHVWFQTNDRYRRLAERRQIISLPDSDKKTGRCCELSIRHD